MEKKNQIEKIRNSVSLKLLVIVFLSLILLIPTGFLFKLINERQNRRNEAIYEVTSKWGQSQTLFTPVILIPYKKYRENSKGKYLAHEGYFHLLPDDLTINGHLKTDKRRRGIYEIITYSSDLTIDARFSGGSFLTWPDSPDEIGWSEAVLATGITDLTGLDKIDKISWNGSEVTAEGGIPTGTSVNNGIHTPIRINRETDNTFHMEMTLNGSESLFFIPAGKITKIHLTSDWDTPSFDGSTITDHNEVNEKGFTADWNVLDLTRSFPQKWAGADYQPKIYESAFGVNLLVPVDIYQKATRSVKYALLFIGLTFLVMFFIEIISKKRVHPVQYLLTGAALIIFYSLLLALSERMPISYLLQQSLV